MLSTCSLASSTASTYSCSTSVAADDRSSISSSSSSQSDTSYGSRHPFWAEPFVKLHLPSETALSSSSLKALTTSDDRLYAAVMGGCGPSSTQLHPRGLHDSGRQSSLDSGIGIATGSSGSFSSCTGSVDMATQGAGEEFGSLATLSPPPPNPPPSPSQCTPHREHSGGPSRLDDERQSSGLLRQRYDTPRSLIQNRAPRDPSAGQEHPSETGRDSAMCRDRLASRGRGLTDGLPGSQPQRQALMQCPLSWLSDRTPPMDNEEKSTPRQLFGAGTSFCEEIQPCRDFDNYITPEQWRTANSRSLPTQVGNSSSGPRPSADSSDRLCAAHRDRHDGDLIRMPSSVPASSLRQPIALGTARPQSAYEEGSVDRYSHGNNGAMATARQESGEYALGGGGQLTRMDNRRRGPLR